MMTSKNTLARVARTLLAITALLGTAVGSAACQQWLTRPARHVVQLGTYPHCRFGVAHAAGLPPQCSMPQPAPDHGPLHLAWQR